MHEMGHQGCKRIPVVAAAVEFRILTTAARLAGLRYQVGMVVGEIPSQGKVGRILPDALLADGIGRRQTAHGFMRRGGWRAQRHFLDSSRKGPQRGGAQCGQAQLARCSLQPYLRACVPWCMHVRWRLCLSSICAVWEHPVGLKRPPARQQPLLTMADLFDRSQSAPVFTRIKV